MEKYIVDLTMDERNNLLSLIQTGKSSAKKLTHARILIAADKSNETERTDQEIGKLLHVSDKTVHRIRKRFVEKGMESALERKRHVRTRPRKIQGKEEAHLVALSCSSPPTGSCRWTLKLLANKMVEMELLDSVSPQTIGRILKKTK